MDLNIVDESRNQIPVYNCNNLFLRKPENSNYKEFTDRVMKIANMLIYGNNPPMML